MGLPVVAVEQDVVSLFAEQPVKGVGDDPVPVAQAIITMPRADPGLSRIRLPPETSKSGTTGISHVRE